MLNVRLGKRLKVLTGVRAQRGDVAAATLCINGVDGKSAFAAAARARQYHKTAAGQRQRQVFEIMLSDADKTYRGGRAIYAAIMTPGDIIHVIHV